MSHHDSSRKYYEKVYNSIRVPSSIPLEMSHHDYKKIKADEVIRLINNGFSEEKALYRATGQKVKAKKNRSVQTLLASAALGGVVLLTAGVFTSFQSPVVSQAISSKETMDDVSSLDGEKTIVVAGMDTRPEKDQGDGTSSDVPGNRTDALAVVKISPASNDAVSIVSIPRDTAVTTENCEDGDSSTVKINSIYDEHGIGCLEDVASSMTGESIDGAVAFNFESFSTIIDSLGGIDIATQGPVIDDTLGVIFSHPGTHHANGRKALDYARARKVAGTGKSDLDRVKRQQKVAECIVKKLKSSSTNAQLSTVKDVITKVLPHTTIDGLSTTDILPLVKLASMVEPEDITSTTINIVGEDEMGNLIYDQDSTEGIFDTMKSSHVSKEINSTH